MISVGDIYSKSREKPKAEARGRYFKVVGDDHSVYIVRHDSETYEWELIFYRREKTERETRE